jgi:uncharacterized membrane protein
MAEGAVRDQAVERMIFFSDAVFAFALTLLALEIRVPANVPEAQFWDAIWALAPQAGAFLISFALAALWWFVHAAAVKEWRVFDGLTAVSNLIFLFFIMLLPFAASTFGGNILNNDGLGIYWVINAGASFSMALTFFVMSRGKGRLIGGIGAGERLLRIVQAGAPGVVFVLGAYWAFTDQVWLSRFCCAFLAPVYFVTGMVDAALSRRRARAAA